MPLLRIRTEMDDRPGRLAVLTAALAAQGADIRDLSVQVGTHGVVDEFVVDVPATTTADMLIGAVTAAAGRRTTVVPAAPHQLIDEPGRALSLAVRLRSSPRALPEVLAELLHADEAQWVAGPAVADDEGSGTVLVVSAGHRRGVRLRRDRSPFTLTEAARANALVRTLLPPAGPTPARQRVRLRDGTEVVIRPLTPLDDDAVREMHERCSLESRLSRYFSANTWVPRRMLRLFCDRGRGLSLVAEGPDGSVVAFANLMYTPEPGIGEPALLVEDGWQGRGLGRALARRLLVVAGAEGLAEVRAAVLGDNARMRALLTCLGGHVRPTDDPAILQVRIPLDPARSRVLQDTSAA